MKIINKENRCFGDSILTKMRIFQKKVNRSSKMNSSNSSRLPLQGRGCNSKTHRVISNSRGIWKIFQKIANKILYNWDKRKKKKKMREKWMFKKNSRKWTKISLLLECSRIRWKLSNKLMNRKKLRKKLSEGMMMSRINKVWKLKMKIQMEISKEKSRNNKKNLNNNKWNNRNQNNKNKKIRDKSN